MKKLIFTISLFLIPCLFFGRIGIADWSCETPHGNEINNFSKTTLYLQNGTQLDDVARWYFYKDCVIGEIRNENYETVGYFVVDEIYSKISTFKTKKEWTSFLNEKKLQPLIWTRWFAGDWTLFDGDLVLIMILIPFISLIVLAIYLALLLVAIIKEKFSFRKPFTLIYCLITGLILTKWLLEIFPQSL